MVRLSVLNYKHSSNDDYFEIRVYEKISRSLPGVYEGDFRVRTEVYPRSPHETGFPSRGRIYIFGLLMHRRYVRRGTHQGWTET